MIEQVGHDDKNEGELYLINQLGSWISPRLVVAALKALTLLTKGKLKAAKSGIKPF